MGNSYTQPDGSTVTSTALSPVGVETLLQTFVLGALGIVPANDPQAYYKVRVGWIQEGQPGFKQGEDVCTITAEMEEGGWQTQARDSSQAENPGDPSLTTTLTYTRCWRIRFSLYGPNGTDHARQIKTSLLLSWGHDQLAVSNLYLGGSIPDARRAPEYFQGAWWERADFAIRLNEYVTDTTTTNYVTSAAVNIEVVPSNA